MATNVDEILKARQQTNSQAPNEVSTVVGDTWTLSLNKTPVHTLKQLVQVCEIDLDEWEVERFVCNKWEVVLSPRTTRTGPADVRGNATWTRPDATPLHENLYQVKAFLKRKRALCDARTEIAALLEEAKRTWSGIVHPVKKIVGTKGGCLEINLADHHFGKMAWQLETKWANYDVKIAAKVFDRALDDLLQQSPFQTYEQILFVLGNDLFNADNTAGTTTKGTQVESDVRIRKTYFTVRTIMIRAIERKLRPLCDMVVVKVVPGNHDYNTTWHLGDSLMVYFEKHKDVIVDNDPAPRKYHRYGNTLLGFTHGDKGRLKDLPTIMAVEARKDFGETKFHEWHTGDKHQSRTEEFHGIRVRILPALCPPDKWHSENGYVGNLRSSEAYHWDKVKGLTNIIIYTDSDDLIEQASPTPTAVAE